MNAPLPKSVGIFDAICHQELHEQLGLVAVYANVAQQMLEVGDAAGADYALRRMGAHARAAITARNQLNGNNKTEAA